MATTLLSFYAKRPTNFFIASKPRELVVTPRTNTLLLSYVRFCNCYLLANLTAVVDLAFPLISGGYLPDVPVMKRGGTPCNFLLDPR